MNGLFVDTISYGEVNAINAFIMLVYGLCGIAFLKRLHVKINKYMIGLSAMYILAMACEAVHYYREGNIVSMYSGNARLYILISVICQLVAAGMWLAFVHSRTISSKTLRRVLTGIGMTINMLFIAGCIVVYVINDDVVDWENQIGSAGVLIWAVECLILIIYTISLLHALSLFFKPAWVDKRRALAMIAFVLPINIFSILQIVTGRDYKPIGWMLAYTLYLYIRMNDLGRAQNRELIHFLSIMDSIKEEYLCIYYVNLDENTFEAYLESDRIKKEFTFDKHGGNYEKMVELYTDNLVYSSDVDKFKSALNRDNIKSRLGSLDDFIFEYRAYKDGELASYEMHVWKAKGEKECTYVVLGFKDVSEEKQRKLASHKNSMILQSLVEGFEYVCYIDFGNETIEEYHTSKRFEYFFDIVGEKDQLKKFDSIFKHGMPEEDFNDFRIRFNRDNILDELSENGSYSIECRMNLGRGSRYYSVKALADRRNPEAVIIGITDIDEQIRAEIEKKERAQEREYSMQLETTIAERTAELHEKAKSLNQINEDIIELLGNITEARDVESGEHIKRVKGFTNILARRIMKDYPEYGLDEEKISLITSASALHDVGKIMIPDAILRKPGRFTPEEFNQMKQHCERGCEILERAPKGWDESYLNFSMEICRSHHEKWDGKGYPNGLCGDEIPISAQIVSVADCFDALTTKRVYKDAYTPEQAFDMIMNGECGAFSPKVMEAFKKAKDEFKLQFLHKEEIHAAPVTGTAYALSDIRLLLVEDNKLTRKITTEILSEEGAVVVSVENGKAAIDNISGKDAVDYDAILMDLMLPDMDGWDVAAKIKECGVKGADEVPIIAISSSSDEIMKQKALDAGMVAYIPKPVSVSALTKILIRSMRSEQDSLKKRLEEVVKRANNDPLTGVKNITAYTEAVGELTRKIADKEEPEFAIVMCDVNHLKSINDTFGHQMGDRYIKNCSKLICKTYAHSPVYRIGGDEFAIILTGEDYAKRNELIDDIGERIVKARDIDSIENGKASLAVGMSVFNPYTDFSVATVAKRADDSMYVNKRMMEYDGTYN